MLNNYVILGDDANGTAIICNIMFKSEAEALEFYMGKWPNATIRECYCTSITSAE